MDATIKKVIDLTETLKALMPIKPEIQTRLNKKFRMEFNYNSNHMEGNTLTYSQTELLLIFDKTDGTHEVREIEEMKAHDVAFKMINDWATDKEFHLTEMDIKHLNKIILVRPFWKDAVTPDGQQTRRLIKIGDYKEFPNSVILHNGDLFEYASPLDTPIKMGELMKWYNTELQNETLHSIALASELHHRFVSIHPFDDGNGRISRLLVNYILVKNNLPPIVIKTSEKKKYLNALNQADSKNLPAFIKYMAEQLIWSLNLTIKAAKGESIDEPDDLDKRLAILEKELSTVDPNEEVKLQFNKDVFTGILNSWLGELLIGIIPIIQKFNRYFKSTDHSVNLGNGMAFQRFTAETAEQIIEELNSQFVNSKNHFQEWETRVTIHSQYKSFIKAGLNTFDCYYNVEVKFYSTKYEVLVDEVFENNHRNQIKLFERLLHKPITESDRKDIVTKLSNTIIENIEYNTKKSGIR